MLFTYKLEFEYDGSKFLGYQKQVDLITVQSVLESVLSIIAKCSTASVCAGRTDAGVHAKGQVAHFSMNKNMTQETLMKALNFHLKKHFISIIAVQNLGSNTDFHARFSAKSRIYEYLILEQEHPPTFLQNLYWWLRPNLDFNLMQEAGQVFIGQHDFTTFRGAKCSAKSSIKTVDKVACAKHDNVISITIQSKSFLYHQVRNMVGAMVLVAQKKWSLDYLKLALQSKSSRYRIKVAPPQGLYLNKVLY